MSVVQAEDGQCQLTALGIWFGLVLVVLGMEPGALQLPGERSSAEPQGGWNLPPSGLSLQSSWDHRVH